MNCNTCDATFERFEAEWSDDPEGLELYCPECGDLLSVYELTESPIEEPLPIE